MSFINGLTHLELLEKRKRVVVDYFGLSRWDPTVRPQVRGFGPSSTEKKSLGNTPEPERRRMETLFLLPRTVSSSHETLLSKTFVSKGSSSGNKI